MRQAPNPVIQIHCRAILFDMDGVLINSTPAVARVWRQWAMERGLDPEAVVGRAHGRPSLATVREFLPHADHEDENREVERREIADLEGVVALPGAVELLDWLPDHQWAIVTSCTRRLAEVRLQAAGLPRPYCFVTSNDITNGKPAPDPYRKGAEKLGFAPEDCVVVEDVPAGVQSGRAAGSRVIALSTTVGPLELKKAGADWVLRDCGDISRVANDARIGQLSLGLREQEQSNSV
jgi:sugar-phosphatase